MSKRVYLSPERRLAPHGKYWGYDSYEHNVMSIIASRVDKYLKFNGFYSEIAQQELNINERTVYANGRGFDLYVALHSNGSTNDETKMGTAKGTLCLYYGSTLGSSYKANNCVLKRINECYPYKTRGLKQENNFTENAKSNATSVYVELAFHDNKDDADWIIGNLDTIAEKIAHGICDYFGIEFKLPADEELQKENYKLKQEVERLNSIIEKIRYVLD